MFGKGIIPIGTALLSVVITHVQAQVDFGGTYAENFDGMGSGGFDLPDGWWAVRAAGSGTIGVELTPSITAGTATGGGIYNVGAVGDSDRALGTLASSSTVPAFGVQLRNTTGATIDSVELSGTMEQWRAGGSDAVTESVQFEYSLNASDIADSTADWVAWPGFDLNERLVFSTSGSAVDGNLADNQWALDGTLSGLDWEDDSILTLRWTDSDVTGSDGLYALENLVVQGGIMPVPEPSTYALLGLGIVTLAWTQRRRFAHFPQHAT